jgi:two-component system, NtrC family, sensor kinase
MNKFFFGFTVMILITNSMTVIVGAILIRESLIPKDKVMLDLRAAQKIYQNSAQNVNSLVHLTASSFFLRNALVKDRHLEDLATELEGIRQSGSLDFLNITDVDGSTLIRARHPEIKIKNQAVMPLIQQALKEKKIVTSTELLSMGDLSAEGEEVLRQATITMQTNTASAQTDVQGLTIVSAAPIEDKEGNIIALIYGGKLLNNSSDIISEIVDLVFESKKFKGMDLCVSSIFMQNQRISTNITDAQNNKVIGTFISDKLYAKFMKGQDVFNEITTVANHRYIAAYGPIKNISGKVVGTIGVGVLEERDKSLQRNALILFFIISIGGVLLFVAISHWIIKRFLRPINLLLGAIRKAGSGNYEHTLLFDKYPPEIVALGDEFNLMISSIKQRDLMLKRRAQDEVMKSERLAMIGQLAAGVAHEINNPLGSILLFTRLILQKIPEDGVTKDNLQRIEKETRRCQGIVQNLLEFARQREPKIESVNINDLLMKTLSLFENQALFHNIRILKNFGTDLPLVNIDPTQIQQVVINMVMNAADAMNGKGDLEVITRCNHPEYSIEVSIKDSGCGIKPENIDKIFEPFFTTKGVGHGTGLGLSISLGIVERHGGTIKVSSHIDQGSVFTVSLPENATMQPTTTA